MASGESTVRALSVRPLHAVPPRCACQCRREPGLRELACLLGLLIWLPSVALAQPSINAGNSINAVGSGARAMGQGNAFIAIADDATAASWNPAGLAQLEKPEISLALEYLSGRGRLSSSVHPEAEDVSRMDVRDLNYLSVAYPFHPGRNLVLSLNYLRLYRFEHEVAYPLRLSDPPGIFEVSHSYHSEQTGSLAALAPALAVDVTDKLSLGLTFNVWNDDLTQSSAFTKTDTAKGVMTVFGDSNHFWEVQEDRYEVRTGYSVVLGAMYRASKQWTLGAVVKPPYTLNLDHTWSNRYEDSYSPYAHLVEETDAELDFPLVAGAGVAWRPTGPLTVSFDATWTQWSEFNLHDRGSDWNPLTHGAKDAGRCEDAATCRLGGEYLLVYPRYIVPLRCGVGYDPGPAVDQTDVFYTASVGTGLQIGRYALDVGYEMRWGNDVSSSTLPSEWGSSEDVLQHRILVSLIVYL